MRRIVWTLTAALCLGLTACGLGDASRNDVLAARQALTSASEMVEFETPAARLKMFTAMSNWSQVETGRVATPEAFFPIVQNGAVVCAPALDPQQDLFRAPDAGNPLALAFDGPGDRWAEDRRDSLQGLSEREAAEYVGRSLLSLWGLRPSGVVQVERASGAPYAAAYVDGILRINPAFLHMAAAASAASTSAPNQ